MSSKYPRRGDMITVSQQFEGLRREIKYLKKENDRISDENKDLIDQNIRLKRKLISVK